MKKIKELSTDLDLEIISFLYDYSGNPVKVNLDYLIRILKRLNDIKKSKPHYLASNDIPDTKKYIMDFYNEKVEREKRQSESCKKPN